MHSEAARVFGAHALHIFCRPLSSASCERVFSFLTGLDDEKRRSMGKDLLRMLLFLKGNSVIVSQLAAEKAAAIRDSKLATQAKETAEQRAKRAHKLSLAVAGAKRKMEQTADQLRAATEAVDEEEADDAEEALA